VTTSFEEASHSNAKASYTNRLLPITHDNSIGVFMCFKGLSCILCDHFCDQKGLP
jgi:hypothetical protein